VFAPESNEANGAVGQAGSLDLSFGAVSWKLRATTKLLLPSLIENVSGNVMILIFGSDLAAATAGNNAQLSRCMHMRSLSTS